MEYHIVVSVTYDKKKNVAACGISVQTLSLRDAV